MKEQKVFIYCRVSSEGAKSLLNYQEDLLRECADMLNVEVFAVAREICSGKHFDSRGMEKLIYYVLNKKIDYIFIYDTTRISTYGEMFAEFKMLCDKQDIEILTIEYLRYYIANEYHL